MYYKSRPAEPIQNLADKTIYWDCVRVRPKECRARAITQGLNPITVIQGPSESEHESHAPNLEKVEAEVITVALKRKAIGNPEVLPARLLRNNFPAKFDPVKNYFEEYYVVGRPSRGRPGKSGRRAFIEPRYPPAIWNQYNATVQEQHRTNNISEGWHNRFHLVIGKDHPHLYSALTEFKKEQADTESCIKDLNLGKSVKAASKRKWIELQRRMRSIVLTNEVHRADKTIAEYIENLANVIEI